MDRYGFYTGQIFDAHEHLGAHIEEQGVVFRTFAPGAKGVCLLHKNREFPMNKVYDSNFYEARIEDAKEGDTYEFRVYTNNGYTDHCDPYGFQMELRPNHKSIVCNLKGYEFNDQNWMKKRSNCNDKPLNIYELHLGSWKKPDSKEWYRYDEIADFLIPHMKDAGYNYVEFLPISEHPCDESWGYQNTGFFAPTSRYGTPKDLMKFIDRLHQNDIGVILDYVPVHFAVDAYGLSKFDGTALYEYPNDAVGVSEWGSCNFMHSRGEVRSFLQSAANYWMSVYHFDGLRMDAISRIIYWQGDERRGVNGNAVDFIKVMNSGLKARHKGCMLIAEDSTNYGNVTKPVEQGGLGFDYKWDMGWMHDTLEYFQSNPEERVQKYHKLTFSMMYFRNEKYLLPYSHDEVVHGKATILQKMNGDYDGKFPQARAMYLYMAVHPGKKLNFMGNEFGQIREWDEKRAQDWNLFEYPLHRGFYQFMKELNHLYQSNPAFYEKDYEEEGFSWLDCHQEGRCIYAITRKADEQELVAVFNFSNQKQDYVVPGCEKKNVKVLMDTEWKRYGGYLEEGNCVAVKEDGFHLELEPFSGILLELK